ncbi:hypothetical protein [uncultured Kordia sp.]|uniref:hypothetical protein n=1 Tax=uncultured Kordia sp. TaxID=507699 RepID=UPI002611BB60|nr:hypothetical protein [uncultured Kordia sp.]
MKKYITLFTFVCVLFLGIQTASAQESAELKAKNRTVQLQKTLELDTDQSKKIYEIFLAYEKENRVLNADALDAARKKVSELLEPAQRIEFKKSFMKEKMRHEKIKGARAN